MLSVLKHYEGFLAQRYLWLSGGMEANLRRFEAFFRDNDIVPRKSGIAIDLGAGPGYQSIPLARSGFRVLAFDLSKTLLGFLQAEAADLPIEVHNTDMTSFGTVAPGAVELVICMGDTLPHLPRREDVSQLISEIANHLEPGGRCILSFRNLNHPLTGLDRFIPVRSDENRIFTCFLDYGPERVMVHDLVYERGQEGWSLHKSAYPKLRLDPEIISGMLTKAGLRTQRPLQERGLVILISRKPD